MVQRQKQRRHYLSRISSPTPTDLKNAKPFASTLLNGSSDLTRKVLAAIDFAMLVKSWESRYRAHYESKTYQRLTLTRALESELKSGGSTSQRYTAEMTLKIGVELHLQSLDYDFESIAVQICQQYPSLSYEHLLKMARHLVIDAENAEDVLKNETNCLRFAELTADGDWSPKKLESEIKKHLGLRAVGRPRNAR